MLVKPQPALNPDFSLAAKNDMRQNKQGLI
jgi:hypothetical protein